MKLLICGSRNWTDDIAIFKAIRQVAYEKLLMPNEITIITGMARGADRLAYDIAKHIGCSIMEFPADWDRYGKRAGFIRNQQMLDEGHPDLVLAFQLDNSRGTQDMIRRATEAGVEVRLFREESHA